MEEIISEIKRILNESNINIDKISDEYTIDKLTAILTSKNNEKNKEIIKIPKEPGIYFVLNNLDDIEFRDDTDLLHYYNENFPYDYEKLNKKKEILKEKKYLKNILYIGKATELNQRLKQYMKYGCNKCKIHKGGRAIWQINNYQYLKVFWIEIKNKIQAEKAEKKLLSEFKSKNTVYPFANWRE